MMLSHKVRRQATDISKKISDTSGGVSSLFKVMGTLARTTVVAQSAQKEIISQSIENLLKQLDYELSFFNPDSEVSKLNNSASKWTIVNQHMREVLSRAIEYAKLTSQVFDPAIGSLVKLWRASLSTTGTKITECNLPSKFDVEQARLHCGIQQIKAEENKYCLNSGVSIDLGGIAKGYAADKARDLAIAMGAKAVLISIGSSSIAVGGKLKDMPYWKVGLRSPWRKSPDPLGELLMQSGSLSVSGDYEQQILLNGQRRHHLIDPMTGYPAKSDLDAVAVLGNDGMLCEAYSSAALILGFEKGLELVTTQNELGAIFFCGDAKIRATTNLYSIIQLYPGAQ